MSRVDRTTLPRSLNFSPCDPTWTGLLTVVYPPELATTHTLEAHNITIGRELAPGEVGLEIDHPKLSRRHLSIAWVPVLGHHVATDLGSRNGSAINGCILDQTQQLLNHNDAVRMGDVMAIYECVEQSVRDDPAVARDAVPGIAAGVQALRQTLARAAADPAPALILGETGAGKERIAAEVHRLSRRRGPYVALNCAALSASVVESQLFGHERGAFTGASAAYPGLFRAAHGGTLFLDEIGELPLDLQPKLLRALESGEVMPVGGTQVIRVDVRIVAATNRDLADDVERGLFRRDLLARLGLWELRVPPLRDRRVDILAWIDRLHTAWSVQRGRAGAPPPLLTARVAEALLLHPWPDNLRGLGRLLHTWDNPAGAVLPPWINRPSAPGGQSAVSTSTDPPSAAAAAAATTRRAEPPVKPSKPTRDELIAVLAAKGWSVRATAKVFDRERKQISRWIDAYAIEVPVRDA